jgi:hypothetical protein
MAFQEFTGREYLKIDIANNFGLDKKDWDERIAWFDQNEDKLHELLPKADEPALFHAGIIAWEKAKAGKASGYPISLDATCSGIQVLAALACDRKAAQICNVVDTGKREDAYVSIYQQMVDKLEGKEMVGESPNLRIDYPDGRSEPVRYKIDRKLTKQAIMTAFYSSTATPKRVFGEGELLNLFYDTIVENAPGCWEINQTMLAIWDPRALENSWILPDNFHVHVKIMGQVTKTVRFLNEPFEVSYHENMPIKGGRSLGANMVHSIDGMVVREMQRRCTYDPQKVAELTRLFDAGVRGRSTHRPQDQLVKILWDHYWESGFLSARILDHLDIDNLGLVGAKPIRQLINSLPKKPFQVMSVHDCFRCLPNYGNDLRRQYNRLLAEIAGSELLSYVVSQVTRRPVHAGRLDPTMPEDILDTNYALS